mgnify:FL=1
MNFEVNPSVIMEDMGLLKNYVEQIQADINEVSTTINSLVGTTWTSKVATAYQTKITTAIKTSDSYLDSLKEYIENVSRLASETQKAEQQLAGQFSDMQ